MCGKKWRATGFWVVTLDLEDEDASSDLAILKISIPKKKKKEKLAFLPIISCHHLKFQILILLNGEKTPITHWNFSHLSGEGLDIRKIR